LYAIYGFLQDRFALKRLCLTEFAVWLCGNEFAAISFVHLKHQWVLALLCQTVTRSFLMKATVAMHTRWWAHHSCCLFLNRFNAVNKRWCLQHKEDASSFNSPSSWLDSHHASL